MRILAIADIHGALSVYEWLLTLLRDQPVDALILAGDLLLGGWENEQREQASRDIVPLLKRMLIPVLYIMGNDDYIDLDYRDEQIQPLHARRLDWGGYSFVGYQCSPPFSGGIHEKQEREIDADLRKLEPVLGEQTVLVTHSPAYGVLDRTYGGEHVGSPALASLLLRKPVLGHIHGHIHDSFGSEGYHFNVAAAGQRRALAIDLPTLTHEILTGD